MAVLEASGDVQLGKMTSQNKLAVLKLGGLGLSTPAIDAISNSSRGAVSGRTSARANGLPPDKAARLRRLGDLALAHHPPACMHVHASGLDRLENITATRGYMAAGPFGAARLQSV